MSRHVAPLALEAAMEAFGFEKLDVWNVVLEALVESDAVASAIPRPYGELADQLRRASLSVVANLAEGVGKNGRDQSRFLLIARGSACESAGLIEAAHRLQLIAPEQRARTRALLLRVVAMLTRMIR
jgi:four helix bundle protein